MEKWPIGVFTSVDAGLGVKLEVASELNIPTIQLHAPAKESRTPENAQAFLARLEELGITLTCVFGGFEGESYADIPTVLKTVGLVPPETRAAAGPRPGRGQADRPVAARPAGRGRSPGRRSRGRTTRRRPPRRRRGDRQIAVRRAHRARVESPRPVPGGWDHCAG